MLTPEENELLTNSNSGTPLGELFRRYWVPCLQSEDIAQPDCVPVRVTIMGEELVAFRDSSGKAGLLDAYCAHRGAPLFFGRNEDCGLRCVYHGWKYDVDGNCVDMPNEPARSRFKEHIQLKAYPTKEAGGIVWAYMGPNETPPPLPSLEWMELPADHVFIEKYLIECNYLQALEGDHDSSHTSALHSTLQGELDDAITNARSRFSSYQMQDKSPKIVVSDIEHGLLNVARRNASDSTYLWRINAWLVPFFSVIAIEPDQPLYATVRVPRDDETSWLYTISYHPNRNLDQERQAFARSEALYSRKIEGSFRSVENMDNDYNISREAQRTKTFTGIASIQAQDRAVIERSRPFAGKLGIQNRSEEHLASADAAIVKIRRRLLSWTRSLMDGVEPVMPAGDAYRIRGVALELPRDVPFEEGAKDYLSGKTWERQLAPSLDAG